MFAYDEQEELYDKLIDFFEIQQVYNAAIREIRTKLDILNDEFKLRYDHNPIHHMESRLKTPQSIIQKLKRRNQEITAESARKNLYDIAGIRVICCYIDDIYRMEELLLQHDDITPVSRKDYITNPKPSGYRSLHLVVSLPIYFADRVEQVAVEIQIRTVAMDVWASLEHQMRYKSGKDIPPELNRELFECAESIAEIDRKMQSIYQKL